MAENNYYFTFALNKYLNGLILLTCDNVFNIKICRK